MSALMISLCPNPISRSASLCTRRRSRDHYLPWRHSGNRSGEDGWAFQRLVSTNPIFRALCDTRKNAGQFFFVGFEVKYPWGQDPCGFCIFTKLLLLCTSPKFSDTPGIRTVLVNDDSTLQVAKTWPNHSLKFSVLTKNLSTKFIFKMKQYISHHDPGHINTHTHTHTHI